MAFPSRRIRSYSGEDRGPAALLTWHNAVRMQLRTKKIHPSSPRAGAYFLHYTLGKAHAHLVKLGIPRVDRHGEESSLDEAGSAWPWQRIVDALNRKFVRVPELDFGASCEFNFITLQAKGHQDLRVQELAKELVNHWSTLSCLSEYTLIEHFFNALSVPLALSVLTGLSCKGIVLDVESTTFQDVVDEALRAEDIELGMLAIEEAERFGVEWTNYEAFHHREAMLDRIAEAREKQAASRRRRRRGNNNQRHEGSKGCSQK